MLRFASYGISVLGWLEMGTLSGMFLDKIHTMFRAGSGIFGGLALSWISSGLRFESSKKCRRQPLVCLCVDCEDAGSPSV